MSKQAMYEVTVERKKRDSRFEFKYWWEVKVYMDVDERDTWDNDKIKTVNKSVYDLQGHGYARTIAKAKKKAMKHILGIEKEIGKGVTFGMVFNIEKDTADNVVAKLKQ